jgi:hypothetical protein
MTETGGLYAADIQYDCFKKRVGSTKCGGGTLPEVRKTADLVKGVTV